MNFQLNGITVTFLFLVILTGEGLGETSWRQNKQELEDKRSDYFSRSMRSDELTFVPKMCQLCFEGLTYRRIPMMTLSGRQHFQRQPLKRNEYFSRAMRGTGSPSDEDFVSRVMKKRSIEEEEED